MKKHLVLLLAGALTCNSVISVQCTKSAPVPATEKETPRNQSRAEYLYAYLLASAKKYKKHLIVAGTVVAGVAAVILAKYACDHGYVSNPFAANKPNQCPNPDFKCPQPGNRFYNFKDNGESCVINLNQDPTKLMSLKQASLVGVDGLVKKNFITYADSHSECLIEKPFGNGGLTVNLLQNNKPQAADRLCDRFFAGAVTTSNPR